MSYKNRILFIEDDRDFYRLAEIELAGSGLEFESALAADRAGCAELLGTFRPDLIISDYHLPDIEGPEILKMAQAGAPLAPFIALSGVVSDQKGLELEKLGAFKYLPKDRLGRLPGAAAAALSRLAYTRPRILFSEDESADFKLELRALAEEGINCLPWRGESMAELGEALERSSPDIIITDYRLAGFTALEVIGLARQKAPLAPVIVISASVGEEKTGELFRAGAADFVLKGNLRRLGPAVRRAMKVIKENIRREAAERELREAVETRRIIFDAVKAPFFLADAKGRIILGNTSASAALGLAEIEGADIFSAPGRYSAEIKKAVQDCGKSGGPVGLEHESGGAALETYVYPVAVAKGERAEFAVISFDITERKRVAAELKNSEEKFRKLFEHSREALMTLEPPSWRFTSGNQAMTEMFGAKSVAEFLSCTPGDLSPELQPDGAASGEKAKEMIEKAMSGGSHFFEWTHKRLNGECFPASVLLSRVEFAEKKFLLATVKDITGPKLAEAALRASEARYRALFDQAGDSILILEMKPDAVPIIRDANAAALLLHGYTREEVVGKPISFLDAKDTPPALIAERTGKAQSGRGAVFTARHQRKDGSVIDLEVSVGEMEGGDGSLFLDISRDVTARNLAEAAVKEAAEIKTKFASMVSHELRSPLTSILAGVGLVLEDTAGLNEEQKTLLELAYDNAVRLRRLINNILDFQKMAAGKMPFEICENDISTIILATARSMALVAKGRGLELKTELAPGLPLACFDSDKIIQVLTNLVGNAIAHTEKGTITVSSFCENGLLQVAVSDTGCGIGAGDLPKLFRAFEQLGAGKDRKAGGTGLGLAIAKEIILAHGGRLWAESEPGKGSVFHFTLPLKCG
ncbi:MAG: hypothetical protein AUJ51_06440 [Elusimicrobia bacterium CG1_02_56_21]|nr:MAG: hypothetical protein AUJ51_06440 [Elusimicrobia bacterium CG1_02_56_21]